MDDEPQEMTEWITETTFHDISAITEASYWYWVKAAITTQVPTIAVGESDFNETAVQGKRIIVLDPPVNVTASDNFPNYVLVEWDAVPFAAVTVSAHRRYGCSPLEGKGGVYVGEGYSEMIAITSSYVRKRTDPADKILAGTPAIYFTTERNPATKYYEPHPLVTDDPKIQRRIIADLERNRVRCFVRSTEWGQFKSRNDARASGDIYFTIEPEHQPRMLIDYIKRNYCQVLYCGVLEVYERRTPFPGRQELE